MCTNPFYIKNHGDIDGQTHSYIPVPCRHCMECLQEKRNRFFNRLVALSEKGEFFTYFITLTYNEEHVHVNDFGFNSLCYRDVQLFFKRLRKIANVKFVVCGEYGSNTARPHYHMILFSDIPLTKKQLTETWKNGFIDIELLKGVGGLSYICKYITKPYQYPASLSYRFGLSQKDWLKLSITEQRYYMKRYGLYPQFVRSSKGLDDMVSDLIVVQFICDKIKVFFEEIKNSLPYGTLEKFIKSGLEFNRTDYKAFQEKMTYSEVASFVDTFHKFQIHGKIDMYLPMSQLCQCLCKYDVDSYHFLKNLSRFLVGYKDWTLYEAALIYGEDYATRLVARNKFLELCERSKKQKCRTRRLYQELLRKDMF